MSRCYLTEIIVPPADLKNQWEHFDRLTRKSSRWKRWTGSKMLENSFTPTSSV